MAPIEVEYFRDGFSGISDELVMPGNHFEIGFGTDADLEVVCDPQDKGKLILSGRSFEDNLVKKLISFHGEYRYDRQRVLSENTIEVEIPAIEDSPVNVGIGGKPVAQLRYISLQSVSERV